MTEPNPNSPDASPGVVQPTTILPFLKLGHFEIIGRIGRGGMGDVFKGFEPNLNRAVAIKVLPAEFARHDEFVQRFYAEASAAAQLVHPNVTQIFFIGEEDGLHFFAMQYVEGQSLADYLSDSGALPIDRVLELSEQIASGLQAAHSRGMVHRDIKPGNILLDKESNRALLADFGLVKSLAEHGMTTTGVVMGTVDYIAPEQGRGEQVDGRSDLYSFGVLMYHMLSGRLPFAAENPTGLIFKHCFEPPPPFEISLGIPVSLSHLVQRLMAKQPAERYQTATDVLTDLRTITSGGAINVPKISTPPAAPTGMTDAAEKPTDAGNRQRTQIIIAPTFTSPDRAFSTELGVPASEDTTGPGWWERTRNKLRGIAEQHAPELVQRLQNTQQQLDGAIREYDSRVATLRETSTEATAVVAELRRLAAEHRATAVAAQERAESGGDEDMLSLIHI